jgi:hypothetical protein
MGMLDLIVEFDQFLEGPPRVAWKKSTPPKQSLLRVLSEMPCSRQLSHSIILLSDGIICGL